MLKLRHIFFLYEFAQVRRQALLTLIFSRALELPPVPTQPPPPLAKGGDEFLLDSLNSSSFITLLEEHENQKRIVPLIELAPYQRSFRASYTWRDPLVGTMEKDPAYVSFVKSLNEEDAATEEQGGVSLDDWMEAKESQRAQQKTTSALLEYLKEKRQQSSGSGKVLRGGSGAGKEKKLTQRKGGTKQQILSPRNAASSTSKISSGKDVSSISAISSIPSKSKSKGKGIYIYIYIYMYIYPCS